MSGPLSGRLWSLHPKPHDEELLSSWLVRLGRAYGAKPTRFCAAVWRHPSFWHRDIDKRIYEPVLTVLAEKTATPRARVLDTTLRGYAGFPEHELYHNGLSPRVLSIGLRNGRRQRYWLQYCPYCLFQTMLVEALQRGWCPLSPAESVSTEQYLAVLQQLGRLLITRHRAHELRTGFCQHLGEPFFEPSFPSPGARALEVLSVADRFPLMLLLGWWLDDWPDRFVAMCAMAKLTITDLGRDFLHPPDWYEEAVEQVARGRFAGMPFASYGMPRSVATTSAKSQLLL